MTAADSTPTERDDVAAVLVRLLVEHQQQATMSDACTCGHGDFERLLATSEAMRAHWAHVADVIADLIAAREQAARAEAWDEAVKSAHLHETEHWLGIKHDPNPYRAALTPENAQEGL